MSAVEQISQPLSRAEVAEDTHRASAATRVVVALVCLLVVILPAAVDPWGRLAFEPLKTSVLRAGAVVITAVWLWDRPRPFFASLDTALTRTALAVVVAAGLATALSLTPAISLGGSFDRGMGWATLVACGLLLVVCSDVLREAVWRDRVIAALVLGSVIPCVYFLVQRAGLDPMHWTTLGVPGSTLASPTFLAGFLVLVAPLAGYKVVRATDRGGLAYAGWLAILLLVCAVTALTTIRGPLIALVAAALTFGVLARPRDAGRPSRTVVAAAVLLALVGVVGLATVGMSTLQRFLTIGQGVDSSVQRLLLWGDSVRLLLANPARVVVGFGPETASIVLERAERAVRFSPHEQWDRAHTLLLDTWLSAGLLGVVALAALVVCAFRACLSGGHTRAAPRARVLHAALAAACVGHLIETAFAFETVVTAAVFWIILGLVGTLIRPRMAGVRTASRRAWRIGSGAVAAVLAVGLVTPAIADGLYGAAHRVDYRRGAQMEEQAALLAPWIEELPRAAGLDWQQVATRRRDADALARAERDLRAAAERGVGQPTAWLRLARFEANVGQFEAADSACEQALDWGPYRYPLWEACAQIAGQHGQADLAALRQARAAELRSPS